jgi:hypothetical protein
MLEAQLYDARTELEMKMVESRKLNAALVVLMERRDGILKKLAEHRYALQGEALD